MDNYGHLFSGDVEALADRMDKRIRREQGKPGWLNTLGRRRAGR
jgi:hypothetical protein